MQDINHAQHTPRTPHSVFSIMRQQRGTPGECTRDLCGGALWIPENTMRPRDGESDWISRGRQRSERWIFRLLACSIVCPSGPSHSHAGRCAMGQHPAPPVEHGETSTGTARRLRGDGAAAVLRCVPDGRRDEGRHDETSHLTQTGTRYLGAHRTGLAVPACCPAAAAAAAQLPNCPTADISPAEPKSPNPSTSDCRPPAPASYLKQHDIPP